VRARILLIRHAATDPRSRLCGSFDLPLSRAGETQVASLAGQRSRHAPPDVLYTSPLRRARLVAEALERAWSMKARSVDWAREIHCGDLEGVSVDVIRTSMPEVWARHLAQDDDRFAWLRGETAAAFRARVVNGLNSLAFRHAGSRIAIVTHAGVVSQALGALAGRPAAVWSEDRPECFTATEIEWNGEGLGAVLRYSDPDWF
jgi:broad specificity phosphatase PhoE